MNIFLKTTLITILASISLNAMQPIRTLQKQHRFSPEEDKKLTDLALQDPNPIKNWPQIAQSFPGRTTRQVRERWNRFLDPSLKNAPWTTEDEEKLITLHQEYGNKWAEMSKLLDNRSQIDIKCRWRSISKKKELNEQHPGAKRKKTQHFTPEEDAKIISILSQYPGISWVQVAKLIPERSAAQIGFRFINFLDPRLNKGPWTTEEDETLITLHQKYGNKWAVISKHLDNRSPNDIKNRWISISKRPTTDSTINQPLEIQKQAPEPTDLQPVPQPEAQTNSESFEFYDDQNTADLFSDFDPENADF